MRVVLTLLVAVACLVPAVASEPGGPLDCSDWVSLEPGLSCRDWTPFPCGDEPFCDQFNGTGTVSDNEGNLMVVEQLPIQLPACSASGTRVQLVRSNGIDTQVLGYIESRCSNPPADGEDRVRRANITFLFDGLTGRVFLRFILDCVGASCSNSGGPVPYYNGKWLATIEGFATTFEILQSYEPATNTLGFRVPYMPEGFQYADYFDTYWGDLATVGNWSQSQPLECGYPASPPSVGDYLTVDDQLPDPPLNSGRYYVTAVNYMGQRRYGRQRIAAVLSGRQPAQLPGCVQP